MKRNLLIILTASLFVNTSLLAEQSWSGFVFGLSSEASPVHTGMFIEKGSLVSVVADGQINIGCGTSGPGGIPSGVGSQCNPVFYRGITLGVVVARIDDTIQAVEGGARWFTAAESGPLSLYVHDTEGHYGDNSGAFAVTVTVWNPPVGDADEDGIDDALEDQLLDAYAPEIRFDSNEECQPTDAMRWLRESRLTELSPEPYWPNVTPFLYEASLDPLRRGALGSAAAQWRSTFNDFLVYDGPPAQPGQPAGSAFDRDLDYLYSQHCFESLYYGPTSNVGIYGHVTPVGPDEWVIQYWQFYGYNNAPLPDCAPFAEDIGDHEGDWACVNVYVERIQSIAEADPSKITRVEWNAHGKLLFTWRRGANGGACDITVNGASPPSQSPCVSYQDNSVQFDAICIYGGCSTWGGGMPRMHPQTFPDVNMHEQFPAPVSVTAVADYSYCGWLEEWRPVNVVFNDGNGEMITPTGIPNLGEVNRPRVGMEVVLHFNGSWGHDRGYATNDCPPGPALHRAGGQKPFWIDPYGGAAPEARYLANWDYNDYGYPGLISNPFRTLGDASSQTPLGATLLVYPGTYPIPQPFELSKPMTIRAPHGGVILGG